MNAHNCRQVHPHLEWAMNTILFLFTMLIAGLAMNDYYHYPIID